MKTRAQRKAQYWRDPEKAKRDALRWAQENRKKSNAAKRAWVTRNPDKMKAAQDAWSAAHPDERRVTIKAYQLSHAAHLEQTNKEWRRKHPERIQAANLRRRTLVRALGGDVPADVRQEVLERDGYRCVYCGKPSKETDHILPLSRGGDHRRSNLCVACRSCNSAKNTKTPREWTEYKRRMAAAAVKLGVKI